VLLPIPWTWAKTSEVKKMERVVPKRIVVADLCIGYIWPSFWVETIKLKSLWEIQFGLVGGRGDTSD
jgi:hypothetical protein